MALRSKNPVNRTAEHPPLGFRCPPRGASGYFARLAAGVPVKSFALLFVALGLPCHAEANHICWVERVVKYGDELHVFMKMEYFGAVRGISRSDGTSLKVIPNRAGTFTLHEGDSAYLSTVPHDVCTAKAVSVNGILGVELRARVCMPNPDIGCQSTKDFVAPE